MPRARHKRDRDPRDRSIVRDLFLVTVGALLANLVPRGITTVERAIAAPVLPALRAVGEFVPAGYRVRERLDVDMDASPPAEVVLRLVHDPDARGIEDKRALIVAWDGVASRWTVVFDSARGLVVLDGRPLVPPGDHVQGLRVLPIASRPRSTDVVIEATLGGASTQLGIVAFDGVVARVVYGRSGRSFETIGVSGRAFDQRLVITGSGYRRYDVRLLSNVLFGRPYYALSGDSRPWIGLDVIEDDGPGLVVREVAWRSPADGLVRRGDVVLAVEHDGAVEQNVSSALAERRAADVVMLRLRRGTRELTVVVTLESWLDGSHSTARTDPADLGAWLAGSRLGVVVVGLDDKGPLYRGGVRSGDEIVRLNGGPVRRPALVQLAADDARAGEFRCERRGSSGDEACGYFPSSLRLTVRRDGRTFDMSVKPGSGRDPFDIGFKLL